MIFKNALVASVSVAALAASTFSVSAQTDLTALYEAAKAEGQLTTIALPHDWCGYGAVIEGFKEHPLFLKDSRGAITLPVGTPGDMTRLRIGHAA